MLDNELSCIIVCFCINYFYYFPLFKTQYPRRKLIMGNFPTEDKALEQEV
jgi:hypothetical protein